MKPKKQNRIAIYVWKKKYLYILLLPCIIYFVIFHYVPMYGIIIAFKDFSFSKGILRSSWVGFDNFIYMFHLDEFFRVLCNSVYLSFLRMVFNFPVPIIIALSLNEVRSKTFKRITQTVIYLPHFISWVVVGGILINFLSPTWGVVNQFITSLGFEPIFFLGKAQYFRATVVLTNIWKEAGWGTIIFLAAIAGVNPELYEAAIVDGANRWHRVRYITLPAIRATIITLLLLSIGRIMSNGFEQIFVLQNAQNLRVSEVFETYTYRLGLLSGRFSFATTVGVFTSTIGMVMIFISNWLAKMIGEDGIW